MYTHTHIYISIYLYVNTTSIYIRTDVYVCAWMLPKSDRNYRISSFTRARALHAARHELGNHHVFISHELPAISS